MDTRRVFLTGIFVSFVFLGVSALTGCGSSGTGPSPSPGQPQVTSLSPSTVVAGSPSFTLTVNGSNFLPTTTVLWDHGGMPTTYISSTVLHVQVPALLIDTPGTVSIAPSPEETVSFVANLTIAAPSLTGNNSFSVSMVPVQANDMALDQANQQLYISVASTNATNANTITALNPQTGVFGSSVSTGSDPGSEPGKLAVSSDSTYIYAGLFTGSVHRYTLPALQSDIDIPLGPSLPGQYDYGQYYAIDVAVQPSNSHSIAVSRGAYNLFPIERGGVVVYDDAIARSQAVPGSDSGIGPIDSLLWNPNGQSLYGINTESVSASALYFMPVSSAGVQLPMQGTFNYSSPFGTHLQFDSTTGYLYSDTGMVIPDPVKGFSIIGSFPLNALQGGLFNPIMVPDGKLNIAYFLGQTREANLTGTYVIEAFDLTRFTLIGTISIPNVSGGPPSKMIRWGNNGLAFLTGTGVYVVSGGFVTSPAP
jgi:hypothetical protein